MSLPPSLPPSLPTVEEQGAASVLGNKLLKKQLGVTVAGAALRGRGGEGGKEGGREGGKEGRGEDIGGCLEERSSRQGYPSVFDRPPSFPPSLPPSLPSSLGPYLCQVHPRARHLGEGRVLVRGLHLLELPLGLQEGGREGGWARTDGFEVGGREGGREGDVRGRGGRGAGRWRS